MATFNKIQAFVEHVAEKVHNLASDTLKVLLSNDAPSAAADAVKADLTSELSTANGYTSGGSTTTQSSSAQSSGTYKLVLGDVVFTASGGTIGPLRYAVLYNDTPTSPADPLIGWHDYGSSISLLDTETLTWDADPTNGILTIA
jgi:hypothetical protein